MPSLADIPSKYLKPDKKGEFIIWLTQLPVDKSVIRKFIYYWIQYTKVPFYPDDYLMVGLRPRQTLGNL